MTGYWTKHTQTCAVVYVTMAILYVTNLTVMGDPGVEHYTSYAGISLDDCFKECEGRVSCHSFEYIRRVPYCKLFGETIYDYTFVAPPYGTVYRDTDCWPELGQPVSCNGLNCTDGEICQDGCRKAECPLLAGSDDWHLLGNIRTIGARIGLECNNMLTNPAYAICTQNGSWSIDNISCEAYGYAPSGQDMYQLALNDSNPDRFFLYDVNLEICLEYCNSSFRCLGVNYFTATKSCWSTDGQHTAHMATMVGWNHYSKNWPVSLHEKNYERYQFTYEEGEAFCTSIGSTIASLANVTLAYNLGFSTCTCGWIDTGRARLSLTERCGYYGPGLHVCDWWEIQYDVFCMNALYQP